MYALIAESSFDAAHFLTDYQGKCENLHGHRWRVEATIEVAALQESGETRGMVIDFAQFKQALRKLTQRLDHMFIVEEGSLAAETVACLQNEGFQLLTVSWRTTAENFATYFHGELEKLGFPVTQVEVDETPDNRAVYRP